MQTFKGKKPWASLFSVKISGWEFTTGIGGKKHDTKSSLKNCQNRRIGYTFFPFKNKHLLGRYGIKYPTCDKVIKGQATIFDPYPDRSSVDQNALFFFFI